MRRVRTKCLPDNCIQLTPSSYARIMAIARESRRPPSDLLATAIALFATAVSNVNLMHPPKLSNKPRPKEQRSRITPISETVQSTLRKLQKGKRP